MKKIILIYLFLICLVPFATLLAQDMNRSRGFSFQGFARDTEGAPLGGQGITVRFSIYPEGNEGSPDYQEEQNLTTDPYGVFQATVGSASPVNFGRLTFGLNRYFLKVEVRPTTGANFTTVSNSEMMAVPYAKAASNGLPPGTILPFGGPKERIPAGFLPCDGSLVNKADYPDLYFAIGDSWRSGTGSQFRLPDLRGMFLRGVNDGRSDGWHDPNANDRVAFNGGNSADQVGSHQAGEFQEHNHGGSTSVNGEHTHVWNNGLEGDDSGSGGSHPEYTRVGGQVTDAIRAAGNHSHTISNQGGAETRPKNAAVWYMIKF